MKKRYARWPLILLGILRFLVATLSMSIVCYIVFALVFSTEEERRLMKENSLYRSRYKQMQQKEMLIGDVVEGLQDKDDAIYRELFETEAPSLDALTATDFIAESDSLSESFYQTAAASASGRTMLMARQVDKNFDAIFRLLETRRDSIPPLTLPLKDMSYVQMGASVGLKQNPLYKRPMQHDGLDLIAPQGAPVYAAASGTVSKVIHSRRGLGNIVEIDHGNGYTTRYCLLADMNVARGVRVRRGQKIGTVGISSTIAAAHLHFEVLFKDTPRDPVHYLFASLSPEDYAHMVYMASATSQSLD